MGDMPEPRYSSHDGQIWYGPRALCKDSQVLVDTQELPGLDERHGVVRMQTPRRLDVVFAAGKRGQPPSLVVGGESKFPSDLVSSYLCRRLQRQVRTLRAVVDVPALFLRGDLTHLLEPVPEVLAGIIGLQKQGVLVLPLPEDALAAAEWLRAYRPGFALDGLQALAGHDRPKPDRQPGWLLRRIPGIGPVLSAQLIKHWKTPYGVFVAAVRGQVARVAGKAIQAKIQKALEE